MLKHFILKLNKKKKDLRDSSFLTFVSCCREHLRKINYDITICYFFIKTML